MLNKKWGFFVPTYKRENPLVLQMLDKDPDLTIFLCCRHEEIKKGFYKHLSYRDRIKILDIGENVIDLGDTRERILNYAKSLKIDYAVVCDDGMNNIVDERDVNKSISKVIDECCEYIEKDKYSKLIAGFTFCKRYAVGRNHKTYLVQKFEEKLLLKDEKYFLNFPGQIVLLNLKVCRKYDLHYYPLSEKGFEDAYFFGTCLQKGLIFAGRQWIQVDGVIPNIPKKGGSHALKVDNSERYDRLNLKCLESLGRMMGVHFEKRYRQYASSYLSFIIWDFHFFREVLCLHRDINQETIDSHFLY